MILRKKTRQLLRGTMVLLMAAGLAGTAVEAEASQSSFQVETTAGDVSGTVGDVVEIPVKISTKQALRGFSGKLSGNYDENILEFQGLDTKELPADAIVSSSGGNFSYLSSSGEHTFSTASYGLKFKILQASEEPVTVTIQDLYYTDVTETKTDDGFFIRFVSIEFFFKQTFSVLQKFNGYYGSNYSSHSNLVPNKLVC